MSTELQLIDAPTAGKRIKTSRVYNYDHEQLQSVIQYHADQGYNFVGIIDKGHPGGSWGHPWAVLLFTKDTTE